MRTRCPVVLVLVKTWKHQIKAVVMGASGGVICGGLLGGFAVVVQLLAEWINRKRSDAE